MIPWLWICILWVCAVCMRRFPLLLIANGGFSLGYSEPNYDYMHRLSSVLVLVLRPKGFVKLFIWMVCVCIHDSGCFLSWASVLYHILVGRLWEGGGYNLEWRNNSLIKNNGDGKEQLITIWWQSNVVFQFMVSFISVPHLNNPTGNHLRFYP